MGLLGLKVLSLTPDSDCRSQNTGWECALGVDLVLRTPSPASRPARGGLGFPTGSDSWACVPHPPAFPFQNVGSNPPGLAILEVESWGRAIQTAAPRNPERYVAPDSVGMEAARRV